MRPLPTPFVPNRSWRVFLRRATFVFFLTFSSLVRRSAAVLAVLSALQATRSSLLSIDPARTAAAWNADCETDRSRGSLFLPFASRLCFDPARLEPQRRGPCVFQAARASRVPDTKQEKKKKESEREKKKVEWDAAAPRRPPASFLPTCLSQVSFAFLFHAFGHELRVLPAAAKEERSTTWTRVLVLWSKQVFAT